MAAESLDDHDVVFGEGHDGGYYLVGLKQMHGFLFKDIPWSTSKVLSQSLHQASAEGLDAALTPPWYDIDTIQDLKRLITDLEQLPDDQLPNTRRVLAELRGMCYGGGSENC
jgi:hypothetical protein